MPFLILQGREMKSQRSCTKTVGISSFCQEVTRLMACKQMQKKGAAWYEEPHSLQ